MKKPIAGPYGQLVFASPANKASLSRLAKAGKAKRIGTGIYVTGATAKPSDLSKFYAHAVAAHFWPSAVISDRSALAAGVPRDGWLFLSHHEPERGSDVKLTDLTLTCRQGPGSLPGDMPMPHGLFLASDARMLLENAEPVGRPAKNRPARAAGLVAVGDKIAELATSDGRLRTTFALFDQIRGYFSTSAVENVKYLLSAASGTYSGEEVASERLSAHLAGVPYDKVRVELFDEVASELDTLPQTQRPALGDSATTRMWLPFFEAYFSNYIEGTKFSVEEAYDIVINGNEPADRPADAHDVAATYELVNSPEEMSLVPANADEFIDIMQRRHAILMAGRPEKNPGVFKTRHNYAGTVEFVSPQHVVGTLREGWAHIDRLLDPFHRALMTMFVVTECHPFDDGNGRLARIMTNAELVARKQQRIVIPNVYRSNYLVALRAATDRGGVRPLASVLDFSRKWVAAVRWADWDACISDLNDSNAFEESAIAEHSGRLLSLPSGER